MEEQAFLTSLRREKEAFDFLIKEKAVGIYLTPLLLCLHCTVKARYEWVGYYYIKNKWRIFYDVRMSL